MWQSSYYTWIQSWHIKWSRNRGLLGQYPGFKHESNAPVFHFRVTKAQSWGSPFLFHHHYFSSSLHVWCGWPRNQSAPGQWGVRSSNPGSESITVSLWWQVVELMSYLFEEETFSPIRWNLTKCLNPREDESYEPPVFTGRLNCNFARCQVSNVWSPDPIIQGNTVALYF